MGAALLARFVRWAADRVFERSLRDQSGGSALVTSEDGKHRAAVTQVVAWGIIVIVSFVAGLAMVERLNVPLSSLAAPATVAGAAIGFGAQSVVRDLLSGFFIFAERHYGYGDVIRVSSPGETTGIAGTVEEVTLRTTKLRTEDGELVILPNGEIRQVTNLSKDWARAVLDIPLAVDADVALATNVLHQVGETIAADPEWAPLLLDDPTVMGLQKISIGFLQVRFVARTLPGKQWEVGRELRGRIAAAFAEAGIASPAPVLSPLSSPS